jgi:hypothetical protein
MGANMNNKEESFVLLTEQKKQIIDDYSKEDFEKIFFDYRKSDLFEKCNNIFTTHFSKQIAFRKFSVSDLFPLFEANKNLDFTKNLAWGPYENFESFLNYGKTILSDISNNKFVMFSIVEKTTSKWIGLFKYSYYKNTLLFTFWINPEYKGNLIVIRSFDTIIDLTLNKIIEHFFAFTEENYFLMQKILVSRGFENIGKSIVKHFTTNKDIVCKEYILNKHKFNKHIETEYIKY